MAERPTITSKTIFGFTINEIVGSIIVIFTVFLFWMNLNMKVNATETTTIQLQAEMNKNKIERLEQIQKLEVEIKELSQENKKDHKDLLDGQTKIYNYLIKR